MKWLSIAFAIFLIVSCFFPWVIVPGKQIIISGVDATGTSFGKPGYLNIILTSIFIVFALIPKIWAQRICIFFATINVAWAARNFMILSRCEAGDCPEVKTTFYLFFAAAILMLIGILLTVPKKQ